MEKGAILLFLILLPRWPRPCWRFKGHLQSPALECRAEDGDPLVVMEAMVDEQLFDLLSGMQEYQAVLEIGEESHYVSIQVPGYATVAQKDAAFMAGLAQRGTIDYFRWEKGCAVATLGHFRADSGDDEDT